MVKEGIVVNRKGDILLELIRMTDTEPEPAKFAPLTHSLLVVKHEGKPLLVFSRFRDHWEVPGGRINPGEDPTSCAVRELAEETGQLAEDIKFEGIMKVRRKPDDRIEYGALYSVMLNRLLPFQENQEITKIILWDSISDIGYIDEIDRALLNMISHD